jgi:dephospho-CoA kinase
MLKVALTGGIATGKSYVLSRLRDRGIPCLDADVLAHEATIRGSKGASEIAHRFGPGVLDPDGAVDRRALAAIVFADPSARRDLEGIVHPKVYRAIRSWLRELADAGAARLAVVDVPLLYETGRERDFDAVVATVCPRHLQVARLTARGLSEVEACRRLDAQLAADEKAAQADWVIDTGGTFADTDRQLESILQQLTR